MNPFSVQARSTRQGEPSFARQHRSTLIVAGGAPRGRRNATFLMRDSRQTEAHLDAAKRSGKHEVIKAAEMPNSKHFARKLGKPRPYGHVESLKDDVP